LGSEASNFEYSKRGMVEMTKNESETNGDFSGDNSEAIKERVKLFEKTMLDLHAAGKALERQRIKADQIQAEIMALVNVGKKITRKPRAVKVVKK
jgi:hypothetical protein